MRAIDENALLEAINELPFTMSIYANSIDCRTARETKERIVAVIREAPTLSPDDLRGVVHCGECSHADKDLPGAIYCTMWDAWEVPEDGFCYKGAKMEVSDDAEIH